MGSMTAVLYSFRRCPYAMRARLALICAGLPFELREVDLKNKPLAMLMLSPKGTVPVLALTEKNQVIDESFDIMCWAFNQRDPFHFYPTDQSLREQLESFVYQNDTQFKAALDAYKYPNRAQSLQVAHPVEQALTFLTKLDTLLEKNLFLLRDTPSILDLAVFPFVRQFARVDMQKFKMLPLAKLQYWLNVCEQSSLFRYVMQKYTVWQPEIKGHFIQHQAINLI